MEKSEGFFCLSQLFWTLLEHMMFCDRKKALVQNALKNMNIKDGGGREGERKNPIKSPQRLHRARAMGTEVLLGCMQMSINTQVRADTQVQCYLYKLLCNKRLFSSVKSYSCSLHISHSASVNFNLLPA